MLFSANVDTNTANAWISQMKKGTLRKIRTNCWIGEIKKTAEIISKPYYKWFEGTDLPFKILNFIILIWAKKKLKKKYKWLPHKIE